MLAGRPYILARDGLGQTRLVVADGDAYAVREQWPKQALVEAARRLLPAPMAGHALLRDYDAYYFQRQVQSMYGADERRLPVFRVEFSDPGATWVHLDGYTGQLVSSLDRSGRVGRWLFNFLHSWDLPAMLSASWLREAALLVLGFGGVFLSSTAVVLGTRRISKSKAKMPKRR